MKEDYCSKNENLKKIAQKTEQPIMSRLVAKAVTVGSGEGKNSKNGSGIST